MAASDELIVLNVGGRWVLIRMHATAAKPPGLGAIASPVLAPCSEPTRPPCTALPGWQQGPAASACPLLSLQPSCTSCVHLAAQAFCAFRSHLVAGCLPCRLFHTTRATLTKHPDSMLAAMFRGDMQATALRDEQGHPFLDR